MQLKLKFNPAWRRGELAPGDRRLWILRSLALRIIQQANPLWQLEIYHRRLLLALIGIAVALWLLAVTSLFLWLNRQPQNQVGWFDLATPWRWSGLRAKRGDTAVLTALDEIKAKDYTSAFYNLRIGVARSPANVEGRVTLAALQSDYDPMGAVTLLEEGLAHCGPDPKLLDGLFALYARFQIQTHALEVIGRLLTDTKTTLSPESHFRLQRTQAVLLIQLARYAEAEVILSALPAPTEKDALVVQNLQLELLLRSGRTAEAQDFIAQHPRPEADVNQRRAAEIAIALDNADALQGALRRLKARSPNEPGVYLFAYQAWHRMKRRSFCEATEREFYQLFANNEGALQALAALAVNLDLPEVIARAQRVAVSRRLSPFAFRVHETELALRRGETEQATRHLRHWENNVDTLTPAQRFHPEFIRRLTHAAFTGTPDQVTYLLSHIAAHRGQPLLPVYLLALSVLEKTGDIAGATQVLQAATRLYPLSEPLLVAQPRLATLLAEASTAATTAATLEKPVAPALLLLPATDKEALAQLDAYIRQEALTATRDLLRAIRSQKPAWQDGIQADLLRREITLAFLASDQLAGVSSTRLYVDRYHGEEDLLQLVPLISLLTGHGHPEAARLLHDEIAGSRFATARVKRELSDLKLGDDLALVAASQVSTLAALERQILTQDWAQADRLLKYLSEKPPEWRKSDQFEIKVCEVQIRLGLDQRPLALAALKELITQPGAPRSAAFKLVRDALTRGEKATALTLAREIVRLLPENPAAAKLLAEAEAARTETGNLLPET